MIVRNCERCGARFHAKPYKVKVGKARYCGVECYREAVKAPDRLCAACGGVIPQSGWSHEAKYCSQECYRTDQPNPAFKGGRNFDKDGYVRVWAPDSPLARADGYALEHRLVASGDLGRDLLPMEVVHHINGIKTDNRPENLRVCADQSEHMRQHRVGVDING